MVFITGDTHGYIDFKKLEKFAKHSRGLTKKDYMIIARDFGAIWDEYRLSETLKKYKNLPFTVLFIDGNHENFNLLNSYEVDYWNGGKVHHIADNIIHLMRGQVFTIEGKTFFTFGGSESIDKARRTEGVSWWKEEVPSEEEYEEAFENLSKVNYEVDYIITHAIDEYTLTSKPFNQFSYIPFPTNQRFNEFEDKIKYNKWYFAHYHNDMVIDEKKTAMYQDILKVITLQKDKSPVI